jgi:hypothetical protein
VWAGLLTYPEGGAYSGGLLRWDRGALRAATFDVPEIVFSLLRHDGTVFAGTTNGIWAVERDGLRRWVLEPEPDGRMMFHAAGPLPFPLE